MEYFKPRPTVAREPRRLVVAPLPSHPSLRPAVVDVECGLNEEVEWLWTLTNAGSFVSGYRIVPRIDPPV